MSNGLAKIALSLDDIPIHLPLAPAKYQDTDKTSSTHAVLFHLGQWQTSNLDIEHILEEPSQASLRIIFADLDTFLIFPTLREKFDQLYGLPVDLWENSLLRANGFVGSRLVGSSEDKNRKQDMWFRFIAKQLRPSPEMYDWYEMTFFMHGRWNITGFGTIYCFNCPPTFQRALAEELRRAAGPVSLTMVRCAVIHQIVRLYDEAVWDIRDAVRGVEKGRASRKMSETDFASLHELARHTIHSTEVLEVAVSTLNELLRLGRSESPPLQGQQEIQPAEDSSQQLIKFYLTLLQNFHQRARSVDLRVHNEINLAYNLVAQRDSVASIRLNAAAQENSAAMRKISIVTLMFLPATFVSTIFSMSFFDYSSDLPAKTDGSWTVSPEFWIYWATAIPLTLLVVLWWVLDQKGDSSLSGRRLGHWLYLNKPSSADADSSA